MKIFSHAELLVPEGSIRPVVSVLALEWFIIYIMYIFVSKLRVPKSCKLLLNQRFSSDRHRVLGRFKCSPLTDIGVLGLF
jgi:hypothetical protein